MDRRAQLLVTVKHLAQYPLALGFVYGLIRRNIDLAVGQQNEMGVAQVAATVEGIAGHFHGPAEVGSQRHGIDLRRLFDGQVTPGLVDLAMGHQHVDVLTEGPHPGGRAFR